MRQPGALDSTTKGARYVETLGHPDPARIGSSALLHHTFVSHRSRQDDASTGSGRDSVYQLKLRTQRQFEHWQITHLIDIEGKHAGYRLVLPQQAKAQEQIERIGLGESNVVAFGISGNEIWTFRVPGRLRAVPNSEIEWRVQRVDLRGDGDTGVLIAARFRDGGLQDTLFYLSSNGAPDWSYEANPGLVDRGGRSFERAWRFTDMVVLPSSRSRGKEAWVTLANDAGWAGCVLRINREGNPCVQFANSGFVEHLVPVLLSNNEQGMIIAGETNAFERAFVALLGVADPPSRSAPDERYPRYRYENAPNRFPRKYILLPRTELIEAQGKPYGHVWHLTAYPGRILAEVETGPDGAFLRYHFSNDLEPQYVFPSGSHEFRHRAFEEEGRIAHSWIHCPERAKPLELDIWEPATGWHMQRIPWRDDPWTEPRDVKP